MNFATRVLHIKKFRDRIEGEKVTLVRISLCGIGFKCFK